MTIEKIFHLDKDFIRKHHQHGQADDDIKGVTAGQMEAVDAVTDCSGGLRKG